MQVSGKVLKQTEPNRILVEIVRTSACGGDCHSCGNCGGSKSRIVAECSDVVSEGDTVLVSIPSKRYFLLSFLVFIVPLFVIVASYLLFRNFLGENGSSVAAFLTGVLSFVLIVLAGRKLKMPKAVKTEQP